MPETTADTSEGAALHAPAARLLRPLVRLFVARGITFPALTNLLRELYVNVAEYDFALPGKEQTDSRVSLLTGIHRKEVRRLRGAGAPVSAVPAVVSRTSRIIARWLADPAFTDRAGRPLPLRRAGDAPSFEALVAGITRDLRPRAVLDEWLDRGLAALDAEDRIVLAEAAYVPRGGEPQLYYFGRNLHDHIAASVANIVGEAPRFLERAVHYDGLSPELAARLEARAREIAMEALAQANREAHAACATDPGGSHRWNFGLYVYAEAVPPAAAGKAGDP
ncbi:DUF6502 family protein [uncultured Methylobacterium sp.]|uniref:DUF6502 family protein n=1 Tax=uncultured Methylobacterium sp. TaxID=157278 RepID=UPI0035CC2A6E